MFVQPQHQDDSRALARETVDYRPNGAPAYYLGWPASLWISASRRRTRNAPEHLADGTTP